MAETTTTPGFTHVGEVAHAPTPPAISLQL
jgi:hypothetical protein